MGGLEGRSPGGSQRFCGRDRVAHPPVVGRAGEFNTRHETVTGIPSAASSLTSG